MTVGEAARRSRIAPSSYSCMENGIYGITLDKLYRILLVLDVTLKDVWPEELPSLSGGRIDRASIQDAIRRSQERQPRPVRLNDVLEAVCRAFEVHREHLARPYLNGPLKAARVACGRLVAELPGLTLAQLAAALGTSPSSLSQMLRRARKRVEGQPGFQESLDKARRQLAQVRKPA